MPESSGLEFTGERVIPGLVDPNLFNEHLARYRFAARFARGAQVLDAGCGSGYGTAEFRDAASVVAVDIAADAVSHARRTFSGPGVHFLQGTCESLPFADESFDLIAAFEVIEHLERWQDMLAEARRVLCPAGVLLVSTPNKAYYAEMRAASGPNPYHVHEFEYHEFEAALQVVFPHVRLWSQNHSEAIAFVPASRSTGILDAPADMALEQAHFFVAACSASPIPEAHAFAWLPSTGNLLRERERHIALLESEIGKKNLWLAQTQASHAALLESHEKTLVELKASNEWAGTLNSDLDAARTIIADLQSELARELDAARAIIANLQKELVHEQDSARAVIDGLRNEVAAAHTGYKNQIQLLETEAATRLDWIRDLESQIARGRDEIGRLETENAERTQWAQSLDAELDRTRIELARVTAELNTIGQSKWVRIGQVLNVAPPPAGRE